MAQNETALISGTGTVAGSLSVASKQGATTVSEQTGDKAHGKQGFASMDVAKQRAIASKGGSAVPAEKRPFARNHELAAAAGRKGGEASHNARRARKAH
jgi:general stress protein YciG